ncbi:MAG TPA: glycosyl transferase [Holosporales bacterium]|nr:glycosyl transferase [Holosporales bacterium]
MSLSGLVVAHNEQDNLDSCLKTLSFCDEIVVVLDKCADASKDIALKHGAKLVEGAWDIEGERRNLGLEVCSHEWVIELDADERISKELAQEITETTKDSPADVHLIPFDNYIGKTRVRYGWGGYFGVSQSPRLTRRGTKKWGLQRVHPKLTLGDKRGKKLVNPIIHYVDRDTSDLLNRLDRYTTLNAQDMRAKGKKETFGHNVRRIFSRFYKCYVVRKGYKEGRYGFLIALCAGLYPILSYLKATLEKER